MVHDQKHVQPFCVYYDEKWLVVFGVLDQCVVAFCHCDVAFCHGDVAFCDHYPEVL